MFALHRSQTAGGLFEGFLPADALPRAALALQRVAQAIGVLVQVFQRSGLGADVAAAGRVSLVALDLANAPAVHVDGNPATGLA
jgi:hypothetical protein